MRAHPVLVAGTDRDVTLWMEAVPGLMAKEGAAGVMAAGLADGRAVAFKIADGSDPARRAVVPQALRRLGVDPDEDVLARVRVPVLGHGREVGQLDALDWARWTS
jgi:L-asparaginase II